MGSVGLKCAHYLEGGHYLNSAVIPNHFFNIVTEKMGCFTEEARSGLSLDFYPICLTPILSHFVLDSLCVLKKIEYSQPTPPNFVCIIIDIIG